MEQNPTISIVSPVYKAEQFIEKLVSEIANAMDSLKVSYEIILVDDRSPDNSWQLMKAISQKQVTVKSIRLSRNFGQHPAIMAGLTQAKGDWVVVMDCDLQDQPKEIIKLFEKAQQGYDVVLARRTKRKDHFFKRFSSHLYSKIYGYFTDTKYDNEIANFGIYRKNVIASILDIGDCIKFFPLFVNFVGFESTSIPVEHAKRHSGASSYNPSKLISLAFNTIISFSNKPLKIMVNFGLFISLLSFGVGIYEIYMFLTHQITVLGYTSIIVSIWFLSGVIITTIGVTGIYIGKVFDQSKKRPVFIIDQIEQQIPSAN